MESEKGNECGYNQIGEKGQTKLSQHNDVSSSLSSSSSCLSYKQMKLLPTRESSFSSKEHELQMKLNSFTAKLRGCSMSHAMIKPTISIQKSALNVYLNVFVSPFVSRSLMSIMSHNTNLLTREEDGCC